MKNANFSKAISVQLRSFAQLAFLETSTAGFLIIIAIALVSVWSALAAILGVLINNGVSLIVKDYSGYEWQLGLAGYNGAIIGIYWGATILSPKGLSLFIVALLLCLFIEFLLRALLTPRRLPILSLPAMAAIMLILAVISLLALDPSHSLFIEAAKPPQAYNKIAAILIVVAAMAYQHLRVTIQTIIFCLAGGLAMHWLTGLNLVAIADLWAFNLALAYFSIAALFLKHSHLAGIAAIFNTILTTFIWYFWLISGLEQLSPPLLLPFIISSLLTLSLLKYFANHHLLQPELWRALKILLRNRQQNKQCVAITGSGIRQGTLPDYPSGQWLDPNIPVASYTLAGFKASKRCRYLYWRACHQFYQQVITARKNNIDKQLDSLLSRNLSGLFTETVDGLFKTDVQPVFECYGSITTLYCLDCAEQQPWPSVPLWLQRDLHCQNCGGLLKPQVLAADEQLAPECYQAIESNMAECGYLLVIGVPALTPVVAMIIKQANTRNVPVICIGSIPKGYLAMERDVFLIGDIATWLAPICQIANGLYPLKKGSR